MRVLVTGGSGYIGRAVVGELLASGHQPRILVHTTTPEFAGEVEVVAGDLLDREGLGCAIQDVGAVMHLGAIAGQRRSFNRAQQFLELNVGGTVNLLDALATAERSGTHGRLIFASTAGIYGSPAHQPIDEGTPPQPGSPYAMSKVAAEQAISAAVAAGPIGACTLRIFNAAGAVEGKGDPDDLRVIPRAVAVAAGRIRRMDIYGDGSAVRDFVHIRDIARAFVAALEHCHPGEHALFNVGATAASVADVIDAVQEVSGLAVTVARGPADGREAREIRADTRRAHETLGWKPEHSTLRQIVADQWAAECGRRELRASGG